MISFLRQLTGKVKKKINYFIKFNFYGLLNSIISYSIYLLLLKFESYQIAYLISYIFGLLISFFFNILFVFKVNFRKKDFFIFLIFHLSNFLISSFVLYLFVEVYLINKIFAPIIILCISSLIMFNLLSKLFGIKK